MSWIDTSGRFNHRVFCHCGHEGRKRWSFGSAVMDVFDHSVRTGHPPMDLLAVALRGTDG